MTVIWIFLAIGLGAGVLSGLFGIGGGIVIVPALMLIAKLPPATATGTSLGAPVRPGTERPDGQQQRAGHLEVRASLWIALGIFLGAYGGALLAQQLPAVVLKRLFAVFLVVVAAKLWTS
jgi:uncharacterized protein